MKAVRAFFAVTVCAALAAATTLGAAITLSQYDQQAILSSGFNASELVRVIRATNANTFSFLLWDTNGIDYLNLCSFLAATQQQRLNVWVTLIPPSESRDGRCSIPADSTVTPWNETAMFNESLGNRGCNDYLGWATAIAKLAGMFPALTTVNIDDFSANIDDTFHQAYIYRMRERLGSVALIPTFYYHDAHGAFVPRTYPWLVNATSGVLFYFRNEKEGKARCLQNCTVPEGCKMPCLSGTCGETSVANLPSEVDDFAAVLPKGHALHVGLYFSAYSHCDAPSPVYNKRTIELALSLPAISGVTVYVTQKPAGSPVSEWCASHGDIDKGCIVRDAFLGHGLKLQKQQLN